MSTLSVASSSSPAISPRLSQPPHPSRIGSSLPSASSNNSSSSKGSPRTNPPPPRRPSLYTQRQSTQASSTLDTTSHLSKYHHGIERDAPTPPRVRYVDSSTQYSPEWYPPTAKPSTAQPASKKVQESGASATRSQSVLMTTASSSTTTSTRGPAAASPGTGTSSTSSSSSNGPPAEKNDVPHTYTGPRALPSDSIQESSPVQEARSTDVQPSASKRSRPDPATWKVMPLKYELCSPKDLGALIANMLMELIRINDKIPLRDGRLTRFHSRAPPGISVSDYLQRLVQHATLSPPILLSMVYYIDRLCTMYPAFTINSLTVHRFLITAATVAAKGLSDSFWTNPTYARIGGIPVPELATLELELLQRVHWKIVPKPEALEDYYYSLVDRTDGYILEEADSESESSRSRGGSSGLLTNNSQEKDELDDDGDAAMAEGPT